MCKNDVRYTCKKYVKFTIYVNIQWKILYADYMECSRKVVSPGTIYFALMVQFMTAIAL